MRTIPTVRPHASVSACSYFATLAPTWCYLSGGDQAQPMARGLRRQGVAADALQIESTSTSTHENAAFSAVMLKRGKAVAHLVGNVRLSHATRGGCIHKARTPGDRRPCLRSCLSVLGSSSLVAETCRATTERPTACVNMSACGGIGYAAGPERSRCAAANHGSSHLLTSQCYF